jgi:hypothetical protein
MTPQWQGFLILHTEVASLTIDLHRRLVADNMTETVTQSAHHFMYIGLGHGHLSPEHDTSQYTLQHTSSPAPNCLQTLMFVVVNRLR